jgi:hypothetical protein
MKRSQSRFTPVEAAALLAIMALIVISTTPKLIARRLTESACSLPDFRHNVECYPSDKGQRTAKSR